MVNHIGLRPIIGHAFPSNKPDNLINNYTATVNDNRNNQNNTNRKETCYEYINKYLLCTLKTGRYIMCTYYITVRRYTCLPLLSVYGQPRHVTHAYEIQQEFLAPTIQRTIVKYERPAYFFENDQVEDNS